ncbi:MAG: flippase-like domain-containing protein [Bacteroidales bacterium]|nr:flippase-like domain-containing protein [Bacteroidales bacterium]
MKGRIKQGLQIAFFFALGIGFIWWFASKLSDNEVAELFLSLRKANYFWIIVAFVISVSSCFVRALRWRQLLTPIGYGKVSLGRLFFAVMSGYLTNLAVPRLGEVVRCAMLKKSDDVPVQKTLGTVITERLIDLLLFGIILLIAFFVAFDVVSDYIKANTDAAMFDKITTMAYIAVVIAALGVIFFAFVRRKSSKNKILSKINAVLLDLWQGIKSILHLKKPLVFVFYSFLIWGLWIGGTYAVFQGIETTSHLSITTSLVVTILSAFGPMITPGGIGLYPAIFAETLAVYSIAKPIGYAAGWLSWLVSQVASAVFGLWGFVYFSQKHKTSEQNH